MRNAEISAKLQKALERKGWTTAHLHKKVAVEKNGKLSPSYETFRRWVSEGGGRLHSDVRDALDRAVKLLGFDSIEKLIEDSRTPVEFHTLVTNFLHQHRPHLDCHRTATNFVEHPKAQQAIGDRLDRGMTAEQIFADLKPSVMQAFGIWPELELLLTRFFAQFFPTDSEDDQKARTLSVMKDLRARIDDARQRGLSAQQTFEDLRPDLIETFDIKPIAEDAPGKEPIAAETQNPSIEQLIAEELLAQVRGLTGNRGSAKWQAELENVKPDGVEKFVSGLMQRASRLVMGLDDVD
jgi:hypothetical protein